LLQHEYALGKPATRRQQTNEAGPVPVDGRVLVMVPSYNDRQLLDELCDRVLQLPGFFTVLVLDDGSHPPLMLHAPNPNVLLFRLPNNYGLGVCTHIAIDHMLSHGYDALVRIDSDGQHPIDMIPALLGVLDEGADVCVGVRTNADQTPGIRGFMASVVRKYYRVAVRVLFGRDLPSDMTSGFIAIGRKAALALAQVPLERYPEPEIILAAHSRGLHVASYPVQQNSRDHGRSTISFRRALLLLYRFNVFILAHFIEKVRLR
jgi:glycosyltransferase involved in cell wall biosynthesis